MPWSSLNYLFIFDPTLPSLSQQSETVQTIDDISVRMGNMSLKPSSWFRNRIYVRYTYKKFTGTFWASHSRTIDPMFNRYTYISDMGNPLYGKFLQQTVNGERDDRINLQLNIGFQELLNHFSIYGIAGWDRYDFTGFGNINCDKRFYSSIQAQAYFGNWTIAANFEITPQYTLGGNQLSRSERWNTIQVQYKWRNWYFNCTLSNPFTKDGALYESITLSDVHPESRRTFIPDNANMVSLSATYRLNFGKGLKKYSRTIKNSGLDTGVSGKAAQKIGKKLQMIASHRQVICVTHSAQIAALADQQLLIRKSTAEGRTYTEVLPLEQGEYRLRTLLAWKTEAVERDGSVTGRFVPGEAPSFRENAALLHLELPEYA